MLVDEVDEVIIKMINDKKKMVDALVGAYIMQEMSGNNLMSLKSIAESAGVSLWKVYLVYKAKKLKYFLKSL